MEFTLLSPKKWQPFLHNGSIRDTPGVIRDTPKNAFTVEPWFAKAPNLG
jgi:hypothetical protein